MNVRGERIIVFGDSLSHHGSDNAPEIWDVDQASTRSSGQPGDLLASMLAEQGAEAVRVNARVSRSAHNFFGREDIQTLLASDAAFRPSKVVVILGTNDIGLNLAADTQDMSRIRDAYKAMGAEVWAIGPMAYVSEALNQQAIPVVAMMQEVFGPRFIDGRPLSAVVGRARDGVHFGPESARQTAVAMAEALLTAKSSSGWKTFIIGTGLAVLGIVVWSYWRKHKNTAQVAGYREMLPGGKAAGRSPGDFDSKQLKIGTSVELEHTSNKRIAREIAMDHLSEDPKYYTKLKRVHLGSLEAAQRRPEQETRTSDEGPGFGPPSQGNLQIGRKSDSYKDLPWSRVVSEAKKEAKGRRVPGRS